MDAVTSLSRVENVTVVGNTKKLVGTATAEVPRHHLSYHVPATILINITAYLLFFFLYC